MPTNKFLGFYRTDMPAQGTPHGNMPNVPRDSTSIQGHSAEIMRPGYSIPRENVVRTDNVVATNHTLNEFASLVDAHGRVPVDRTNTYSGRPLNMSKLERDVYNKRIENRDIKAAMRQYYYGLMNLAAHLEKMVSEEGDQGKKEILRKTLADVKSMIGMCKIALGINNVRVAPIRLPGPNRLE